jgi:hypothetical protein
MKIENVMKLENIVKMIIPRCEQCAHFVEIPFYRKKNNNVIGKCSKLSLLIVDNENPKCLGVYYNDSLETK